MKKVLWLIVCLMTITLSANAQVANDSIKISKNELSVVSKSFDKAVTLDGAATTFICVGLASATIQTIINERNARHGEGTSNVGYYIGASCSIIGLMFKYESVRIKKNLNFTLNKHGIGLRYKF